MPGSYVAVRLPSQGTLVGEAVARHPGSAVTCVASGRHEHDGHPIVDHLALVEGLPDAELPGLLLGWKRLYGEAPQVLGGPFALRLPVALDVQHTPTIALCLRVGEILPEVCQRVEGDVVELWARCKSAADAAVQAARVRRALSGLPVLSVEVGEPPRRDVECWELLRMAADDLVLDCQALAA